MHCRYTVSNTRLKCIHTLSHTLSPLALHIRKLQFYHSNGLAASYGLWTGFWFPFGAMLEGRQNSSVPKFSTGLHGTQAGNICSLKSKNIPHSCGPGKWQIGKWVTEYCVAITHCLHLWREEKSFVEILIQWNMCNFCIGQKSWIYVSLIMLLSVLLAMGNWKRVH